MLDRTTLQELKIPALLIHKTFWNHKLFYPNFKNIFMVSLIKRIDQIIEDKSLLKHSFYQMWSDGKLELDSLKGYSKEYYQLVKQVPQFMEPMIESAHSDMKDELIQNMKEESEHIQLYGRNLQVLWEFLNQNYKIMRVLRKPKKQYQIWADLWIHLIMVRVQCMHLKKKFLK